MVYVLLDHISTLKPPELAVGMRTIAAPDGRFSRFPEPNVLSDGELIEHLSCLGTVLIEATLMAQGHPHLHAVLAMVDRARFRRKLKAGDCMELAAHGVTINTDAARVRMLARVEGQLVAEAELTFACEPLTEPAYLKQRREQWETWLAAAPVPTGANPFPPEPA